MPPIDLADFLIMSYLNDAINGNKNWAETLWIEDPFIMPSSNNMLTAVIILNVKINK